MSNKPSGQLVVIIGPSGVGKGTIITELLRRDPGRTVSVSATTRPPRGDEVDGEHYFFLDRERFQDLVSRDLLLEYAEYGGNLYGTPREKIERELERGTDVLLDIDIQGALQVKGRFPKAILVFILPPSLDELVRRLRERGTEDEDLLQKRIRIAFGEINQAQKCDYLVVNERVEDAADAVETIIRTGRLRPEYTGEQILSELQRQIEQMARRETGDPI